MLTRTQFKNSFKEELKRRELPYKYNSSMTFYPKYESLCKEGPEIDMFNFIRSFYLAPLPTMKQPPAAKAVPASPKLNGYKANWLIIDDVIKEEGKTPMRYNDNYASASVHTVTPQSDTSVQRDYLLSRLARAENAKETELFTLFNMGIDNSPKTFKELIDAVKNDKFTVDKKVQKRFDNLEEDQEPWYWGPLHGIIWDGKQPDPDGYHESMADKDKQYRATKDIIMGGIYMDGLKALQDFEAWLPTPAETTTSA